MSSRQDLLGTAPAEQLDEVCRGQTSVTVQGSVHQLERSSWIAVQLCKCYPIMQNMKRL